MKEMTEVIDLEASKQRSVPTNTKPGKPSPNYNETKVDIPEQTQLNKGVPDPKELNKEIPPDYKEENCITLKGRVFEIKPTKMKYFRNGTANIFTILKNIPLSEFFSYNKGVFDENRDSDQIMFDFLIAVFDNSTIVRDNYDDMTVEDIERILSIFGRLNHFDEKEERARKNREAQAMKR